MQWYDLSYMQRYTWLKRGSAETGVCNYWCKERPKVTVAAIINRWNFPSIQQTAITQESDQYTRKGPFLAMEGPCGNNRYSTHPCGTPSLCLFSVFWTAVWITQTGVGAKGTARMLGAGFTAFTSGISREATWISILLRLSSWLHCRNESCALWWFPKWRKHCTTFWNNDINDVFSKQNRHSQKDGGLRWWAVVERGMSLELLG